MSRQQSGVGRYFAGEKDVIICPQAGVPFDNLGASPKRALLFDHGGGGDADDANWPNASNPEQGRICKVIAESGRPVVSTDSGGPWVLGNTTSRSRLASAKTYMQAAAPTGLAARSGTIMGLGVSGGGIGMCNYHAANPTHLACMVLIQPVLDPEYINVNDPGGIASFFDTAYGGSYDDATMKATSNPSYMATAAGGSKYAGLDILCFYVSDDIYTPQGIYTQFAADVPTCTLINLGALGHGSNASMLAVPMGTILDFYAAHD